MLRKLSVKEKSQLDEIIKEWIDLVTNGTMQVHKKDIEADINWLYKQAKLDVPKLVMAANLEEHKTQVKEAETKNKFKFILQEFGLGYESWLCLYEFLEKIDYTHNKDFMRYVNLMKKGIFSAVFTDKIAFVCKMPLKIRRNDRGQLHSITKPTIHMTNGDDFYFIRGVKFEKELWTKIVQRKMTVKDIATIENMEQRYIAFDLFGPEELFKKAEAKLIDSYESLSKNLNNSVTVELYEMPNLIKDKVVKVLKYKCHSTARPYFSFVPADQMKAQEAMAWKYSRTPEQFALIDIQA